MLSHRVKVPDTHGRKAIAWRRRGAVQAVSRSMQSDPAATFIARMPGAEFFAPVCVEGEEFVGRMVGAAEVQVMRAGVKLMSDGTATLGHDLLFWQIEENGVTRSVIEEAGLS